MVGLAGCGAASPASVVSVVFKVILFLLVIKNPAFRSRLTCEPGTTVPKGGELQTGVTDCAERARRDGRALPQSRACAGSPKATRRARIRRRPAGWRDGLLASRGRPGFGRLRKAGFVQGWAEKTDSRRHARLAAPKPYPARRRSRGAVHLASEARSARRCHRHGHDCARSESCRRLDAQRMNTPAFRPFKLAEKNLRLVLLIGQRQGANRAVHLHHLPAPQVRQAFVIPLPSVD